MENNDIFSPDDEWEQESAPAEELAKVKKLLIKHDQKTILKSITIITALVLVFAFVLVPLTETLHWNPDQYHYSEIDSDLKLTLQAYMELFCPGKRVTYVHSTKSGYASYDLRISIHDTSRETWDKVEATLSLSDLSLEAEFYDTDPRDILPFRTMDESEMEDTLDTLTQLPEYITVQAAISFPEDQDMSQIFALWIDYTWSEAPYPLSLDWVAVRNCGPDETRQACGFSLANLNPDAEVNEYYPEFYRAHLNPDGEYLQQHFKSLLQYSSDQWEKGRGMDVTVGRNYYDAVLEYVEENGVMSYGCIVSGTPQALLNLLDQGIITQVRILDAWLDVE